MRLYSFLILFSLSMLLGSCYCFLRGESGNVRHLMGAEKGTVKHCLMENGKASILVTPYYGAPLQELKLKSDKIISEGGQIQSKKIPGQFGIKLNTFLIVPRFPIKVIGLGFDYSYSCLSFEYNNIFARNSTYQYNRYMAEINFVTLVSERMIGSINVQGGPRFVKEIYQVENPYQYTKSGKIEFDYRIGYSLHYFFSPKLGVMGEVGYSGGGYGKLGLNLLF